MIDGREILPDAFWNEDVVKGVLIGGTHIEPRSVHALNETTFLVTYSSGILAKEIGMAIEKIDEWLGKPVLITCNEVTAVQVPQVIEHAHHTTRVESLVFNTRLDKMKSYSNPSAHSYVGDPSVQGVSGTTFLNKMPGLPWFSGMEREDIFRFEQWLHSISDARKTFNNQWVRAVINKSCVGDAADAMCWLPPGATLDDIIDKIKWLYGSVESFDNLMQEFYQIVQGKVKGFRLLSSVWNGS